MPDVPAVATDAATPPAEGAPETQPQAKTEAKPPEPVAPKTYKAKVHGREVELPEQEVIEAGLTAAQIRRAATEQFEQAKKMRAEVDDFRAAFSKDPISALEEFSESSPKFREMVEGYLIKQIQQEQLDPQERARMDLEKQLAAERKKNEDSQKSVAQQRQDAMTDHYRQELDVQFGKALATSGLPKTPETVRRLAGYVREACGAGLEIEQAIRAGVHHARSEMLSEQVSLMGAMEGSRLLQMLGPDVLKKIRAADLASLKTEPKPAPLAPVKPNGRPRREEPNPHLMSRDAWLKAMGGDDKW